MDEQTVIRLDLLKSVFAILVDRVEALEGSEVRLDVDYYWSIVHEQLYSVYRQPEEFTVGQLGECVTHLEQINENPSAALSYGLVWLADVIRAIGHAVIR